MDYRHCLTDSDLLEIIQYSDVVTLKNLRLTSHSIHNLIAAYEFSISRSVAKRRFAEFAIQRFRPYHDSKSSLRSLFCIESRQRRARWLSDLVLEKYEEIYQRGAGITNYQARTHFTNGWGIHWQMTDIANSIEADMQAMATLDGGTWTQALTRPHAARLRDEWLAFVATFSEQDCLDYNFLQYFVAYALRNRVFEDPRREIYEVGTGNDFAGKASWLNWLVLRDGPTFFERARASEEGNQRCVEYIYEQWSLASWDQRRWGYDAARRTEAALRRKEEQVARPGQLFRDFMEGHRHEGTPLKLFRDVPFFIGHQLSDLRIREWEDYGDAFDRSLQWLIPGETPSISSEVDDEMLEEMLEELPEEWLEETPEETPEEEPEEMQEN
ncbi:hypothetical protein MMC30_004831 [Trapelia coarctata]|nr:hypothetical protein [Trapelia coarctata]